MINQFKFIKKIKIKDYINLELIIPNTLNKVLNIPSK